MAADPVLLLARLPFGLSSHRADRGRSPRLGAARGKESLRDAGSSFVTRLEMMLPWALTLWSWPAWFLAGHAAWSRGSVEGRLRMNVPQDGVTEYQPPSSFAGLARSPIASRLRC